MLCFFRGKVVWKIIFFLVVLSASEVKSQLPDNEASFELLLGEVKSLLSSTPESMPDLKQRAEKLRALGLIISVDLLEIDSPPDWVIAQHWYCICVLQGLTTGSIARKKGDSIKSMFDLEPDIAISKKLRAPFRSIIEMIEACYQFLVSTNPCAFKKYLLCSIENSEDFEVCGVSRANPYCNELMRVWYDVVIVLWVDFCFLNYKQTKPKWTKRKSNGINADLPFLLIDWRKDLSAGIQFSGAYAKQIQGSVIRWNNWLKNIEERDSDSDSQKHPQLIESIPVTPALSIPEHQDRRMIQAVGGETGDHRLPSIPEPVFDDVHSESTISADEERHMDFDSVQTNTETDVDIVHHEPKTIYATGVSVCLQAGESIKNDELWVEKAGMSTETLSDQTCRILCSENWREVFPSSATINDHEPSISEMQKLILENIRKLNDLASKAPSFLLTGDFVVPPENNTTTTAEYTINNLMHSYEEMKQSLSTAQNKNRTLADELQSVKEHLGNIVIGDSSSAILIDSEVQCSLIPSDFKDIVDKWKTLASMRETYVGGIEKEKEELEEANKILVDRDRELTEKRRQLAEKSKQQLEAKEQSHVRETGALRKELAQSEVTRKEQENKFSEQYRVFEDQKEKLTADYKQQLEAKEQAHTGETDSLREKIAQSEVARKEQENKCSEQCRVLEGRLEKLTADYKQQLEAKEQAHTGETDSLREKIAQSEVTRKEQENKCSEQCRALEGRLENLTADYKQQLDAKEQAHTGETDSLREKIAQSEVARKEQENKCSEQCRALEGRLEKLTADYKQQLEAKEQAHTGETDSLREKIAQSEVTRKEQENKYSEQCRALEGRLENLTADYKQQLDAKEQAHTGETDSLREKIAQSEVTRKEQENKCSEQCRVLEYRLEKLTADYKQQLEAKEQAHTGETDSLREKIAQSEVTRKEQENKCSEQCRALEYRLEKLTADYKQQLEAKEQAHTGETDSLREKIAQSEVTRKEQENKCSEQCRALEGRLEKLTADYKQQLEAKEQAHTGETDSLREKIAQSEVTRKEQENKCSEQCQALEYRLEKLTADYKQQLEAKEQAHTGETDSLREKIAQSEVTRKEQENKCSEQCRALEGRLEKLTADYKQQLEAKEQAHTGETDSLREKIAQSEVARKEQENKCSEQCRVLEGRLEKLTADYKQQLEAKEQAHTGETDSLREKIAQSEVTRKEHENKFLEQRLKVSEFKEEIERLVKKVTEKGQSLASEVTVFKEKLAQAEGIRKEMEAEAAATMVLTEGYWKRKINEKEAECESLQTRLAEFNERFNQSRGNSKSGCFLKLMEKSAGMQVTLENQHKSLRTIGERWRQTDERNKTLYKQLADLKAESKKQQEEKEQSHYQETSALRDTLEKAEAANKELERKITQQQQSVSPLRAQLRRLKCRHIREKSSLIDRLNQTDSKYKTLRAAIKKYRQLNSTQSIEIEEYKELSEQQAGEINDLGFQLDQIRSEFCKLSHDNFYLYQDNYYAWNFLSREPDRGVLWSDGTLNGAVNNIDDDPELLDDDIGEDEGAEAIESSEAENWNNGLSSHGSSDGSGFSEVISGQKDFNTINSQAVAHQCVQDSRTRTFPDETEYAMPAGIAEPAVLPDDREPTCPESMQDQTVSSSSTRVSGTKRKRQSRKGDTPPLKRRALPPRKSKTDSHQLYDYRAELPNNGIESQCETEAPESPEDTLLKTQLEQAITLISDETTTRVGKAVHYMKDVPFPRMTELRNQTPVWTAQTFRYVAYKLRKENKWLNISVLQELRPETQEYYEALKKHVCKLKSKNAGNLAACWNEGCHLSVPLNGVFLEAYTAEWSATHINFMRWDRDECSLMLTPDSMMQMLKIVNPEKEAFLRLGYFYMKRFFIFRRGGVTIDLAVPKNKAALGGLVINLKNSGLKPPSRLNNSPFVYSQWTNAAVKEYMKNYGVEFTGKQGKEKGLAEYLEQLADDRNLEEYVAVFKRIISGNQYRYSHVVGNYNRRNKSFAFIPVDGLDLSHFDSASLLLVSVWAVGATEQVFTYTTSIMVHKAIKKIKLVKKHKQLKEGLLNGLEGKFQKPGQHRALWKVAQDAQNQRQEIVAE